MKTFISLAILLSGFSVKAQVPLFYLNRNMQSSSKDSAVIVGLRGESEKNFRVNCYLIKTNQLIMSVDFADSSMAKKNGAFTEYYGDGKKSRLVNFANDVQDGITMKWETNGKLIDSMTYCNGQVINKLHYTYLGNSQLISSEFTDNEKNEFRKNEYVEDRVVKSAFFVGDKGMVTSYDKKGQLKSTDSVYTRKRTSASFYGGTANWRSYLERTLNGNVPVLKGAPAGLYTVIIKCVVNAEGELSDFKADGHWGYGMEEEAIRVLRASPRWTPATEYGLPVKSMIAQPISFSVAM